MSPPPLAIATIADADIDTVVALWQRCGLTRPWNDPHADIALARRDSNSTILVGRDGDAIVASAMVGHDGHRGWVYYVAVDPDRRARGLGRAIMAAAEDWLRKAGILKLQLLVRRDNAQANAFYSSLGFVESTSVMFAKWLDGRDPTSLNRRDPHVRFRSCPHQRRPPALGQEIHPEGHDLRLASQ